MLRIGELASRTGVSVRSIRHYAEAGLLETERTASGYRLFDERAIEHVQRIRVLLRNGFTLDEIRDVATMIDYRPRDRRAICADVITLYRTKLEEVDGRLAELKEMRDRVADRLAVLEEQRAHGGPDEA